MILTKKRAIAFEELERIATVLKAISHPVRLEILEVLEVKEPITVSDIRACISVKVEQSMLSHHLIKMKDKGVVTSTKQGKNIYYRLTDRSLLNIFNCLSKCNFISK